MVDARFRRRAPRGLPSHFMMRSLFLVMMVDRGEQFNSMNQFTITKSRITIDEVSSGMVRRVRDLSRFALEVSHAIAEGANIMIVFAGIRVDLEALVEQERTTFLRRSRELDFRRLSPAETRHLLAESVRTAARASTAMRWTCC